MDKIKTKKSCAGMEEKIRRFADFCRKTGLRVTPQRIEVYKQLISTDEHPSAEILYEKVRKTFPSISFDTVNRTLLTLSRVGAAYIVEGSESVRRFDGGIDKHQHFKCIKCKRIIDLHNKAFDDIKVPASIGKRFTVLKKTIYLEGVCDLCKAARSGHRGASPTVSLEVHKL
jgi:Fur family peroxide stress response transcriptional regulator